MLKELLLSYIKAVHDQWQITWHRSIHAPICLNIVAATTMHASILWHRCNRVTSTDPDAPLVTRFKVFQNNI